MAERQKIAKGASERKNRDLVAQVQRNADWIQRLWELLRETRAARYPFVDEVRNGSKWNDAVVFDRLKLEARAASRITLQEFTAQGISIIGSRPRYDDGGQTEEDRWSHAVDTERGISRLVCVRRLPFDVHSTSAAVWSALTAMKYASAARSAGGRALGDDAHTGPSTVRVLERSLDACALKYRQLLSFGGQTAPMDSHAVAQALNGGEDHGAKVFVWRSLSAMEICDSMQEVASIASSDVLWVAVTSYPSSHLSSKVAIIAQSQIESALDASWIPSCLTRFQEAVEAAAEGCVNEIVLTAENLLMNSEIARRRGSSDLTKVDVNV